MNQTKLQSNFQLHNKPQKQSEKMLQMGQKCPRQSFFHRRSAAAVNAVSIWGPGVKRLPHLQRVKELL